MRVLFVCSGNICRSPMAAELLRDSIARAGLQTLAVDSAGTLGIEGCPASAEAAEALWEVGLDLGRHRSRGVAREDIERADVVIVMTHDHLAELERHDPHARTKTFLLRAFENGALPDPHAPDLDDPIGETLEVYRQQREILRRSIEHLLEYLRGMS